MPWTEITRADYDRRFLRYASDCTDEEWHLIAPFLTRSSKVGRPRTHSMRHIWNAISYIASTGCQWAMLPNDFPPFTTVQYYFYRLRDCAFDFIKIKIAFGLRKLLTVIDCFNSLPCFNLTNITNSKQLFITIRRTINMRLLGPSKSMPTNRLLY